MLGRAAHVHPVLIIFCFFAGGMVLGIPGVILAVPVALGCEKHAGDALRRLRRISGCRAHQTCGVFGSRKIGRNLATLARPQDVIGFGIYVTSFFGATVHWRGADYRVTSDGTLIEGQDLSKAET